MAGTNKILKDLQDFVVSPPAGLFTKIWKKIRKQVAGTPASADPIHPAETPAPEIIQLTDEKILSGLQSYTDPENTPPAFDFKKISEAITGLKEAPVDGYKEKRAFSIWYKIAAAAAISGIIIFIYYTSSVKVTPAHVENIALKEAPLIKAPITDSTTPSLIKKDLPPGKHITAEAVANHLFQYNGLSANNYITQHVKARVLYNDFLYTLVNFNDDQAAGFLSDIENDHRISLNNYSYVNVSDKMAKFLKQMYALNRKNKPGRKAKKLKSRLAKWKKKDEANFDNNIRKNPLDIIDLSEFIFKK